MSLFESPRRRGRPKKDKVMEAVTVRLSEELILGIDEYLEILREKAEQHSLSVSVNRADAIRQLLVIGLKAEKLNKT